jgi:DNA-binding SARP family transcriptional activator
MTTTARTSTDEILTGCESRCSARSTSPTMTDGRTLPIAGARLRALLIRLALDAGRTVGIESLTEAVWAADPPSGAANALQTLVSRLRRGLPTDTVTANQIGYQVTATVDVDDFDSLVRDARAAVARGDFADARVRYDAALARWRGAPLADVATADFPRGAG